jgi:hypothetical protein
VKKTWIIFVLLVNQKLKLIIILEKNPNPKKMGINKIATKKKFKNMDKGRVQDWKKGGENVIFLELALAAIFAVFAYYFYASIQASWRMQKHSVFLVETKEKYLALYELYKMDEQLKEKSLSFDQLDEFGLRFNPKNRDLKTIDAEYKTEKK